MTSIFRKIKTDDQGLLALQANIAAVLDPLIKQGFNDFSPDIGQVNEYGAAPPQAPEVYEDGMSITLKPANTNTGPSTLSVNGMPRKAIVALDGAALVGGEIMKDGIATMIFDGAQFRLMSKAITSLTAISEPPIGSIIGWHKSFANTPALPSGWAECNGQTLNDSESVYDGQTIPDLNGDARFLRGSATSGTEQAEDFLAHTHTQRTRVNASIGNAGAAGSSISNNQNAGNTSSVGGSETRPINMSVVWIMRVK